MHFYLQIPAFGAIYCEMARELRLLPLINLNKWRNELIVDLPYTQIIFTPKSNTQSTNSPAHEASANCTSAPQRQPSDNTILELASFIPRHRPRISASIRHMHLHDFAE